MTLHPLGSPAEEQVKNKLETIGDVLATTTDKFELSVLQLLQKCELYLLGEDVSDFEEDEDAEDDEFKDPLQRKKQRRHHFPHTDATTHPASVSGLEERHIKHDNDDDDGDSLPDISVDELRRLYRSSTKGKEGDENGQHPVKVDGIKSAESKDKVQKEDTKDGHGDDDDNNNNDDSFSSEENHDDRGRDGHRPASSTGRRGQDLSRAFNTSVWSVVEDSLYTDPYLRSARAVLQGGIGASMAETSDNHHNLHHSTTMTLASGSMPTAATPSLERDSLGRFEFNILWEDFQKWFAWHGASVANTFTVSRSNYHYKRGSRAGQVRMHYTCCLNNKQQKKKYRSAGKITQYFQPDPTKVEDGEVNEAEEGLSSMATGKKRKQKQGTSKITTFFQRAETEAPPSACASEGFSSATVKDDPDDERPCKAGFTATKMVGVRQDGFGGEVEYCHIVYAYRHNHPLDHQPVPGLPLKLEGVKERIKPRLARGSRLDRVLRRLMVEYPQFKPPKQSPPGSTNLSSAGISPASPSQHRARDDVLTLADVFDLWYQLTIKEELTKASQETHACRLWMEDLKKEDYFTMMESTRRGELYGWTSLWQLELIRKYGGVLALDRFVIFPGAEAYLYTLTVHHHECRLGVPVAMLLCPVTRVQEDLETWLCFVLASMRTALRLDYVPQGVFTYLGAVEVGALQQVFHDSIVFPGALYGFSKRDHILKWLLNGEEQSAAYNLLSDLRHALQQGFHGQYYINKVRAKAKFYKGLSEHLDQHYLDVKLRETWCTFLNTNPRYYPGISLRFTQSLKNMVKIYPLQSDQSADVPHFSSPGQRLDHVIGAMTRLVLPNYRWTLDPAVWRRRQRYVYYMANDNTGESLEDYFFRPREVHIPTLPNQTTPDEWVRPASKLPPLPQSTDTRLFPIGVYSHSRPLSRSGSPTLDLNGSEEGMEAEQQDEQEEEDAEEELLDRFSSRKYMARGGPRSLRHGKASIVPSREPMGGRSRSDARSKDRIQQRLEKWAETYRSREPGELDCEDELVMILDAGYSLLQRAIANQRRP